MSLIADLGYGYGKPNVFNSLMAWAFSTTPGAWVGRRLVPFLDRLLPKLFGQNATASMWFAALPPLWLTTTGARSGQLRRQPLFGIPYEGSLAVIGSNFGQANTPGWVFNLEADPEATIEYDGKSIRVVAREASPAEEKAIWAEGAKIYVGYAKYRSRVKRDIRVFVLDPPAIGSG